MIARHLHAEHRHRQLVPDGRVLGDIHRQGRVVDADIVGDEVIEGSITLSQAVRLLMSVIMGKSSGGGTNTIKFRDLLDSKDRITATVDSSGNRSDVVLDAD